MTDGERAQLLFVRHAPFFGLSRSHRDVEEMEPAGETLGVYHNRWYGAAFYEGEKPLADTANFETANALCHVMQRFEVRKTQEAICLLIRDRKEGLSNPLLESAAEA